MRSARAGLNTLFVCHNPELARWVQQLTSGSGVEVKSFERLVDELAASTPQTSDDWSSYSEPTSEQLGVAFDAIVDRGPQFDAVIVDEGQDFADDWWTLVEALLDGDDSYFYIFFDDQQSLLLTRGASYPLQSPPLDLSRNCRNAGEIYGAMRVLSPHSPEPELALARLGAVHFAYRRGDLDEAVNSCVTWLRTHGMLDPPLCCSVVECRSRDPYSLVHHRHRRRRTGAQRSSERCWIPRAASPVTVEQRLPESDSYGRP